MRKLIILIAFITLSNSNTFAQTSTTPTKNVYTLELIGGLSAGLVYNTYIVIGSVADGHAGEVYDDKKTKEILQEQERFIHSINKMVDSTISSGEIESQNDLNYLKEVSKTLRGLILQARYYRQEVEVKDGAGRKKYGEQRTANWQLISTMLGLND